MKWSTQILSWAFMIAVARLLVPADFGMVTLASTVVGLPHILNQLGLDAALVQKRDLTREQIARLGGMTIAFALLLALASTGLSFPLSHFYHEPALPAVVAIMSLTFVTTAFQTVPRAMLQSRLRFGRLALLDSVQVTCQSFLNLGLAWLGFRYWTLVLSNVLASATTAIVANAWYPHRLSWPQGLRALSRPLTFGWQVLLSRLGWYLYSNADYMAIGRVLDKSVLGSYSMAFTLGSVPVDEGSALVGRVVPGVFSAAQQDRAGLRRYLLGLTQGLAIVGMPAAVGLALTSEDFVRVALGPKWEPAIVPIRLLALYGGFECLAALMPHVLVWTGHAKTNMYLTILAVVFMPPAFYIGTRWGVTGVAAAWVLVYPAVTLIAFWFAFRIVELRVLDYLKALWPAACGSLAMACAVLLAQWLLVGSPVAVRFAVEVTAGAALYVIVLLTVFRPRLLAFTRLIRNLRGEPIEVSPVSSFGSVC